MKVRIRSVFRGDLGFLMANIKMWSSCKSFLQQEQTAEPCVHDALLVMS